MTTAASASQAAFTTIPRNASRVATEPDQAQRYKPARYHILLAARLLSQPEPPPAANSHAMERYCKPLIDIIWNNAGAEFSFGDAARVVEKVARGNFDRDSIRTQGFTEELKQECVAAARAYAGSRN